LDALPTLTQNSVGRPKIGKSRVAKITLPGEDWDHIDNLISAGRVSSVSAYFRSLHESSLQEFLYVDGSGHAKYAFPDPHEEHDDELEWSDVRE